MTKALGILVFVALLATACGSETAATGQPQPDRTTPTTPMATQAGASHGDCPVTIPPQPGFVPPEPYPEQPPDLYQSEWYGSASLWTMLGPNGEVWEDLPKGRKGFSQKTLWWSEDLSPKGDLTPITLTGRRLDRPGSFETGDSVGASFREDIGAFMVVGFEIPAGCWELTARYGDAELSYVVSVEGLSDR